MSNIKRRATRQIKVGRVPIGGASQISIQSMTKVKTSDVTNTVKQINKLERAGCEIVRVAVKDTKDAKAIRRIKRQVSIPVVADIHFDKRLALLSIESGADKIRINPGNIPNRSDLKDIVEAARRRNIPIRIGVNSGSIPECMRVTNRRLRIQKIVNYCMRYIKIFEGMNFRDIIISIKSSDVVETVSACRSLAKRCRYPLHLGITAAGVFKTGVVKSSIGIGALLMEGIGDTVRVSLTGDPVEEVYSAREILKAVGARELGYNIISCPTCGRCQVDLESFVRGFESDLYTKKKSKYKSRTRTIAIMGCEVNGPGEAKDADVGIAFGKGAGILFNKGKIVKKVSLKKAKKALTEMVKGK